MQTTMRINDAIFRDAKTEAAREGMTLTHFVEEALTFRLRLGRGEEAPPPVVVPTFDSGKALPASFDLNAAIRESAAQEDGETIRRLTNQGATHAARQRKRPEAGAR